MWLLQFFAEQAIYLYVFRHSRLLGVEEVLIGFKSARKKMALYPRQHAEAGIARGTGLCRTSRHPNNVVAACRQCNNRKNASPADDWLRTLYRDGFLGAPEFEQRLSPLQQLRAGFLKPSIQV